MVAASIQKLGCWKFILIFFQRVIYSRMTILDFYLVVQMSQMCTVSPLNYKAIVSTL